MKKIIFALLMLVPTLASAQWQRIVDKIFDCHSVRFDYVSAEWNEYYGFWENPPADWDERANRIYYGSFDFENATPTAIRFLDKNGTYFPKLLSRRNGYMFSSGGDYNNDGLTIFIDEVYPKCKFCVGSFMLGLPMGSNVKFYSEDGTLLYEGDFFDDPDNPQPPTYNYPNAHKRFEHKVFPDGSCYVGETFDGNWTGYGLFVWSTGDAWFGLWKDGLRHGFGVVYYSDCTMQTGYWYGDDYYTNPQ